MAGAGEGAVHSMLARVTGHVAEGPPEPQVTETLPSGHMTRSVEAVAAVVLTVVSVGAIRTMQLTTVSGPAGITVGALSVDMVTDMSVLAGGAGTLTVVPKEPRQTFLVTLGAIPARLTGDTASLRYLAWLLALTVTALVPAVLSVGPGRTGFPAELPSVTGRAGA